MHIEKYRVIESSVMHNKMLRNVANRHAISKIPPADHRWMKDLAEEVSLNLPHQAMTTDPDSFQTVPNLSEADIRHLAAIQDVLAKLQRERDRIYAQFERKRRPLVQAAVTKLEAKALPPHLPD